LELLATLQHFGVPTRLIDVTFNPWVATFFSVAAGRDADADVDGRLFVIDVTERLIEDEIERSPDLPWPSFGDWTARVRAWKPAGFEKRIAAQYSGFLLGGVPDTAGQWRKAPADPAAFWNLNEQRAAASLAVLAHRLDQAQAPENALFTLRISSTAKDEIRKRLASQGFDHATLFADAPGLADHGIGWLKDGPPSE
jgi:hypothetical protein